MWIHIIHIAITSREKRERVQARTNIRWGLGNAQPRRLETKSSRFTIKVTLLSHIMGSYVSKIPSVWT